MGKPRTQGQIIVDRGRDIAASVITSNVSAHVALCDAVDLLGKIAAGRAGGHVTFPQAYWDRLAEARAALEAAAQEAERSGLIGAAPPPAPVETPPRTGALTLDDIVASFGPDPGFPVKPPDR